MGNRMKKIRDLFIILMIYILAYVVGYFSSLHIDNEILKFGVFDIAATVVTYVFSVILANSSVYDAYWSLTPMVMSIWLFVINRAFAPFQIAVLVVFNIWSLRLTANWISVFTDFSYEDWRYRKYRSENNRFTWPIVNFFGIHFMPTVFVFAGMLPLFVMAHNPLGGWSIPGIIVIISGVVMELLADKAMHRFIAEGNSGKVCYYGLWNYSRHPNYLGEITVWLGVYVAMLPYAVSYWYYCVGFVVIAIMFNTISIPLMEKRQLARRPEYAEYRRRTSRLLILPTKQ